MIPAPSGLAAYYKHEDPDHVTTKRIVAFDGDGRPLIVNPSTSKQSLVGADTFGNYDGFGEDPSPPLVAIMPGGGWRIQFEQDGLKWSQPLVGWGLRATGEVVPLDTDTSGIVMDLDGFGGEYRIYHPDTTEPQ